ncbi:MAG TPA: GGDEF domain-containing protein, partial [Gammaproteobacteria bacterium]|nr:GGDEF domain-containing protein [Gammaproteobacteria bacterium]
PAGDLVLKQFAECCVQTFPRRSDFVARYGGEEFAIILQETAADAAKMLGERLLHAVQNLRIPYDGQELCITISVGIAEMGIADDAGSWLRRADSALYRAKASGRNRLVQAFNI